MPGHAGDVDALLLRAGRGRVTAYHQSSAAMRTNSERRFRHTEVVTSNTEDAGHDTTENLWPSSVRIPPPGDRKQSYVKFGVALGALLEGLLAGGLVEADEGRVHCVVLRVGQVVSGDVVQRERAGMAMGLA